MISGALVYPASVNVVRHSLQDKQLAKFVVNLPQSCPICGNDSIHLCIADGTLWCNAEDKNGEPTCFWQQSIV